VPSHIAQAVTELQQQGFPIRLIAISTEAQAMASAHITLHDPQQRFKHRYAVPIGGAYLFRPDQHICGRWLQLDAAGLKQSLRAACLQ
jgi:3-(3-hydroxy-phenyl)propionate hydroxylase